MYKHILFIFLVNMSLVAAVPSARAEDSGDAVIKKITKAPKTVKIAEEPLPVPTATVGDAKADAPPIPAPIASPSPAPAAKAASVRGPSPDTSLRWLMNGNTRYTGRKFRKDGRGAGDRKRLLEGQRPHSIVLSCSDSRVPPEIIFDQMLGEIITIRVAGPSLDSAVIASLEDAVENHGARLLVIMAHDKCGTIEAALREGAAGPSPDLERLIADIRPRLRTISPEKLSPGFEVEAAVNADGLARDLLKRSEIVRKRIEAGDLVIKPALYHLDNGKVSFY